MNNIIIKEDVNLPGLPKTIIPAISELTTALRIPREVLASSEEIEHAWQNLPREIREIPRELRGELVARMCVAVSTGLFDGAMNYIWNAAILQLRQKIKNFGLAVVAQIQQKNFEEKDLQDLQDSRLLELCLKLNIIDEDGFFFLDQCRAVRNNFSAAHPTMGKINDREFISFLNRCIRYALADSSSPKGVDISAFISAVKGTRFTSDQLQIWVQRLTETHDAQRQLLVNMVHGIYCDSATAEPARLNVIDLCEKLSPAFTSSIKESLVDTHSEYIAKGIEEKSIASRHFFEKLGLIGLLNETEQHMIFSRAIERLWDVHNSMNNFYNEPPFAERLLELSRQEAVPETVQEKFVQTVACCRVGNGYGVSNAAVCYYDQLIKDFSPREVVELIRLAKDNKTNLGYRIDINANCKRNFQRVLALIDIDSVPNIVRGDYDNFLR